jgi:lipid A oxidase
MKSRMFQTPAMLCSLLLGSTLIVQADSSTSMTAPESAPLSIAGQAFYVELFGGYTTYPDLYYDGDNFKMDDGFNIGGSIGTSLNDSFDVEFEAFYTETSYAGYDDEFTSLSLMTNAYYNFPIYKGLLGYVGGGLGAMQVSYEYESTASDDAWVFAYQLIAGVRYPINDKLTAFTEYRLSNAAKDATLFGDEKVQYESHNISIGLRYNF